MKRLTGVFLFVFFVTGQVFAQDFGDIIDFDTEIKQLSDRDNVSKMLSSKKVLILDGTVLSIFRDEDNAQSETFIVLQEGEWVGYSDIRSYSIRLRFVGDQWLERFFGDGETVDLVSVGTKIIAVVTPQTWNETIDMVDADVLAIRVIN